MTIVAYWNWCIVLLSSTRETFLFFFSVAFSSRVAVMSTLFIDQTWFLCAADDLVFRFSMYNNAFGPFFLFKIFCCTSFYRTLPESTLIAVVRHLKFIAISLQTETHSARTSNTFSHQYLNCNAFCFNIISLFFPLESQHQTYNSPYFIALFWHFVSFSHFRTAVSIAIQTKSAAAVAVATRCIMTQEYKKRLNQILHCKWHTHLNWMRGFCGYTQHIRIYDKRWYI